jgi:pyruvate dehydrogenase E2 component (dihydrolipoamide acetyltransferase)
MSREFLLPDLGSGLKEGEIVQWRVAVGDVVTTDDLLVDIETEKAVVEIPVPYDGTVIALGAEEGGSVKVGSMLAVFDTGDESDKNSAVADKPSGQSVPTQTTVAEKVSTPPVAGLAPAATDASGRIKAMPAVRRISTEFDVDISQVTGTGRHGQVTKGDVLAFIKNRTASDTAMTDQQVLPGQQALASEQQDERVPLTRLGKTIAANMSRSWREIPHIFTRMEARADGFLEVRKSLSDVYDHKVGVEALLIRAVLPALKTYPEFNATLEGDELVLHRNYNICVAVNTDAGLVLPTVHNADQYSVRQLSGHLTELLPKAVQRKASPAELSGGTFTINNLGALGKIMGTSIIPIGTTAILSAGRAMEKAVVQSGEICILPMMEITLSFDHRVIDGGMAQKFLALVCLNIEEAARMLA